jgi:hypothetical protein
MATEESRKRMARRRQQRLRERQHRDPDYAALRAYQQQHGLGVSGAPDEPTLKQLQIRLPTSAGDR